VTKCKAVIVIMLVKPKAAAWHELLFNKLAWVVYLFCLHILVKTLIGLCSTSIARQKKFYNIGQRF
jgi:hypothetical protein